MAAVAIGLSGASAGAPTPTPSSSPIKHVVVVFDENESFDHYFGTYPNAANPAGEPQFTAAPGTPSVNGLTPALLTANPNSFNPTRLDRSRAVTCSQSHGYGSEQAAFDGGLMDKFPENTAGTGAGCKQADGVTADRSVVMDYYDGNTVTGLWNLAQNFSMSDNSYSTQFGPSTVGAINLISGNTHGVTPATGSGIANGTINGDPDPSTAVNDDCANGTAVMNPRNTAAKVGGNVGDAMNEAHVTWGWFQGGFRPTATVGGKAVCGAKHNNVAGGSSNDYSPHHNPFAYYSSTANPHHLPPSSVDAIGTTDQANHEYDLTDFDAALDNNNLPQVSFLKASQFEDAHPGNSDPLDEQRWIARVVDSVEQSPDWASTAIVVAYDDSDGWYDHQMSPIMNPSAAADDALNGAGHCGNVKDPSTYIDRCGYGPRQPLLVISPFAKQNYVDHSITDQTSILKFIEDNWQLGRMGDQSMDAKAGTLGNMFDFTGKPAPKVFLDPTTGQVIKKAPKGLTVNPDGEQATYTGGKPDAGDQTSDDATQDTSGTDTTTQGDTPAPAVTAPATDAPATAPVVATSTNPLAPKAVKLSLTCTTKGKGKTVTVSCKAKGAKLTKATALRFRIVAKGGKVIATTAAKISGAAKISAKLHTSKAIKKGKYTLRVTITQAGAVSAKNSTIRLG
ncbi:MAG TPA: alkaline phosphatase family protein [Baekduia sp.]